MFESNLGENQVIKIEKIDCIDRTPLADLTNNNIKLDNLIEPNPSKTGQFKDKDPNFPNRPQNSNGDEDETGRNDNSDSRRLAHSQDLPPQNIRNSGEENNTREFSSDVEDNQFTSNNSHINRPRRKPRTVFSRAQLSRMKEAFSAKPYLTTDERKQLAAELKVTAEQIKVWFQNHRSKLKRQGRLVASNTSHVDPSISHLQQHPSAPNGIQTMNPAAHHHQQQNHYYTPAQYLRPYQMNQDPQQEAYSSNTVFAVPEQYFQPNGFYAQQINTNPPYPTYEHPANITSYPVVSRNNMYGGQAYYQPHMNNLPQPQNYNNTAAYAPMSQSHRYNYNQNGVVANIPLGSHIIADPTQHPNNTATGTTQGERPVLPENPHNKAFLENPYQTYRNYPDH